MKTTEISVNASVVSASCDAMSKPRASIDNSDSGLRTMLDKLALVSDNSVAKGHKRTTNNTVDSLERAGISKKGIDTDSRLGSKDCVNPRGALDICNSSHGGIPRRLRQGHGADSDSEDVELQRLSTSLTDGRHDYLGHNPVSKLQLTAGQHHPGLHKLRLRKLSQRSIEAILGTSPPSHIRLARDLVQPRTGSISDVHAEAVADEDDEELDTFPTFTRPRSMTCPENGAFLRRVKARRHQRPPTPPPGGADDFEIEATLSKQRARDKLHIGSRNLPQLTETPKAKEPTSDPPEVDETDIFQFDT